MQEWDFLGHETSLSFLSLTWTPLGLQLFTWLSSGVDLEVVLTPGKIRINLNLLNCGFGSYSICQKSLWNSSWWLLLHLMAAFGISGLLPLELSWAPPLVFIFKPKGKMILKYFALATFCIPEVKLMDIAVSFWEERAPTEESAPVIPDFSLFQSLVPSAAPWSSRCGTATPTRGCQKRMGMRMNMWWVQDLFPFPIGTNLG